MILVYLFPKIKNCNFDLFVQMKILMFSDEKFYPGEDGYKSDPHPCGSHLTHKQRCGSDCLGGDIEQELGITSGAIINFRGSIDINEVSVLSWYYSFSNPMLSFVWIIQGVGVQECCCITGLLFQDEKGCIIRKAPC